MLRDTSTTTGTAAGAELSARRERSQPSRSSPVLTPLPFLVGTTWMSALPILERPVLVMQAEEARREPPLHGATQGVAPAPAVGVATALASAWIVDPLQEAMHGSYTVRALAQRLKRTLERLQ
jgi:hypothetical protein